ncbi:4'-phosphopantetheinyl transferase superfamily protein [Sphingomonas sp. CROZ-RG-20F-R02-07]|uniref:4'-phosphopantetheinyl transferase family protein n=1 Tax=Sphingomonas sp. CROZ-RG-20F-R02-07 TaxID=2914832 RepID=UPI001F573A23
MIPVWHDGPLATLVPGRGLVVWSVATRTDPGIVPSAEDLSDAARVTDGAGRLARRLLARALVRHVAGCASDAVTIRRDAHGAPIVVAPAGWFVSLSGRSDRALIGVARVPVGVDREPLACGDVPWDMLTPDEAASLQALPPGSQSAAWLTRWTIKEAHAKLVGEPRRIAPEAVATHVDQAGHGGATFEGRSGSWTRIAYRGVETVAIWQDGVRGGLASPNGAT